MRLTPLQMQKLAEKILGEWKSQNLCQFKVDEKKVLDRMIAVIRENYDQELEIEREANKMLADLERTHSGQFERYKMYPMLKQKIAKERKFIL